MNRLTTPAALAILLALAPSLPSAAQLVLSGNEAKLDLTSGAARVVPNAPPDSVTVLDFSEFPPRVEHLMDVPNTVIGPPSNIAIAPGGKLALIANSIQLDALSTNGYSPHTEIHVVDLRSRPARVVSRLDAGRQPSGISITGDGRQALVANRADGTISVLSIDGYEVKVVDTLPVCRPEEGVADVAIRPKGRLALASVHKGGYLAVLEYDGRRWKATGRKISVYGQPYRCAITSDGRFGLTAGQGQGNALDIDALSVVDLESKPIRTVDYVPLGAVPESFDVSPDGKWVAAVLMNGSNLAAGDPLQSSTGSVVLVSRRANRFLKAHELPIGRIPEGVAFTSDGKHVVVQCHPSRQLWILSLRHGRLHDTGVRIDVPGMPSSLRAAPAP